MLPMESASPRREPRKFSCLHWFAFDLTQVECSKHIFRDIFCQQVIVSDGFKRGFFGPRQAKKFETNIFSTFLV